MAMSESFRDLSEKLGGFNPKALESFFYWNDPFALKHWTMNIVELLMCAGAGFALMHAVQVYRRTSNATNLCFWFISVGYLFVIEVPLYFPELIGGDPEKLRFLHNEFSAGLFFDRTPLYIVALYPALTYPAYVLIEKMGVFNREYGLLLGAVSVGFLHHCFYEIFDHYGPQYGWWVWNYDMFSATIASVPLASIYTFAFVGPAGLTLVTRLLISSYISRRQMAKMPASVWHLAALCLAGSFLVPLTLVLLTPDLYYQVFLPAMPTPFVEKAVSLSILAMAAVVTLYASVKSDAGSFIADELKWRRYPHVFLGIYLVIFAALWLYALPEYLAATGGTTARATPVGSLVYTIGCCVGCLLILYLSQHRAVTKRSPIRPPVLM